MAEAVPDVTLTYDDPAAAADAFDTLVNEFADGLSRLGIDFEPWTGGRVRRSESLLGTVTTWAPGHEVGLRWNAMPWGESKEGSIRVRFEPHPGGTRVTWSLSGWGGLFGSESSVLPEWVASELLPTLLGRLLPEPVGDWTTDRGARRPAGARSREYYRDPIYHWPNFWLILDRIHLGPGDRLLEVGCGGGAFLRKALESGCTATGVDHSPQMVRVAREVNADNVRSGRVTIETGDAAKLPVPSESFTCCISTGAFGFFPDHLAALREMRRALRPGGRLAVYASTAALRGTPAVSEPAASRIHFFERPELEELARAAGFSAVHVEEPDMEPYARRAGIPAEAMPVFQGNQGSLLLLAERPA